MTDVIAPLSGGVGLDGLRRFKSSIQSVHFRDREITSGTNGPARINLSMYGKTNLLSDDIGSQIIEKFSKSRQLTSSRFSLFKITDQADAYAYLVDIVTMNMTAFQLFQPSRTDFDFTISRINPVTDHKMISQSILHTALPMCPVVYCRVAELHGAMVADDPLPTLRHY